MKNLKRKAMVEEYIYKEAETLKRRKRGVTLWQQFLLEPMVN